MLLAMITLYVSGAFRSDFRHSNNGRFVGQIVGLSNLNCCPQCCLGLSIKRFQVARLVSVYIQIKIAYENDQLDSSYKATCLSDLLLESSIV